MDFDSFFESLKETNIVIKVDKKKLEKPRPLNNDALFQLPLICLVLLLMAKIKLNHMSQRLGNWLVNALKQACRDSKAHPNTLAGLQI